jgi:hypothetical protein
MYREETECGSKFYEYIGMADVEDRISFFTTLNLPDIREKALEFRKKSLEYYPNGFELEILDRAINTLMPYCNKHYTIKEKELFITHYGLKGVHYYKQT